MPIDLEMMRMMMAQSEPAFAVVTDQDDRPPAWAGVDFGLGLFGEEIEVGSLVSWLLGIGRRG